MRYPKSLHPSSASGVPSASLGKAIRGSVYDTDSALELSATTFKDSYLGLQFTRGRWPRHSNGSCWRMEDRATDSRKLWQIMSKHRLYNLFRNIHSCIRGGQSIRSASRLFPHPEKGFSCVRWTTRTNASHEGCDIVIAITVPVNLNR